MKFKNDVETAYTDDPYYDLFDDGHIKPENMLATDDANKVQAAINLIESFLAEAESLGYIEIN